MNPTFKVWQIEIDENDLSTGVEYVALVDTPAILRTWQAFNDQKKLTYQVKDTAGRHIVQGPIMIPDMPIYRNDDTHGEHYVIYTKDTIERIVRKFFKQKNTGNVNLMHLPSATTNGAFMFESFIIDSERGIRSPEGFDNLPDGTWFGSYVVSDEKIWQAVMNGSFSGFSVEGFFNYGDAKDMASDQVENLINAVVKYTNGDSGYLSIDSVKTEFMKLKPEVLTALKKLFMADQQASNGILKDGTQVTAVPGFTQGSALYVVTPDGNIPAPDGNLELDNGTQLEVMNGVIMNVTEPAADATQANTNEDQSKENMSEEKFTALEAKFTELSAKVTELIDSVKGVSEKFSASEKTVTELGSKISGVEDRNKQVFELLQKLETEPASEGVQKEQEKSKSEGQKPRFAHEQFAKHAQLFFK